MKNAKYYPLLNSKNIEESKAVVNNDNDAMVIIKLLSLKVYIL